MKQLKSILICLIIGLLIGLWFGINIGKDKPLFSNPFAEDTIQEKIKKSSERLIEKSGEAMEKGGRALKGTAKDAESQLK